MPLLLLLVTLALAGTALAQLGERWPLQMQREREAELLFRGQQIASAIEAYQRATPPGQPSLPRELEDLLEDRRDGRPRHWLRQLYPDPFTGQPDWELLREPEGGLLGVRSRSTTPALRQQGLPVEVRGRAGEPTRVADWTFLAPRVASTPPTRQPGAADRLRRSP